MVPVALSSCQEHTEKVFFSFLAFVHSSMEMCICSLATHAGKLQLVCFNPSILICFIFCLTKLYCIVHLFLHHLFFSFPLVWALFIECCVNAVVKVTGWEITCLRVTARLVQCVFEVAGWAGSYRLSLCLRVTGSIPIAGVPVLCPPPSETLPRSHPFVRTSCVSQKVGIG